MKYLLTLVPAALLLACANPGTESDSVQAAEIVPVSQSLVIAVTGMRWGNSCAKRVNNALASLPWVEEHNVDFPNKVANITVNGDWNETATIKAITDLGFGAEMSD